MDGLVPGRIVYFVFDEQSAAEVMRRRTTGQAIADRLKSSVPTVDGDVPSIYGWPAGAQAHIGNDVRAGDICPAMVVATSGGEVANLKVMLDGSDTYWATSVHFTAEKLQRSWHWMFDGQNARYQPTPAAPPSESPV
jgi:hypothetical protein